MDPFRSNGDGGTILEFDPILTEPIPGPERAGRAFLYFLKGQGFRVKTFGANAEPLVANAAKVNQRGGGDFSTIQAALDAGSRDIFVEGDYVPTSTPMDPKTPDWIGGEILPDADVRITFAGGSTVRMAGAQEFLRYPDGLTARRTCTVHGLRIVGDETYGSALVTVADANGLGNFVFHGADVRGISAIMSCEEIDRAFLHQTSVTFYDSYLVAMPTGSYIGFTPGAAGDYLGPALVRSYNTTWESCLTLAGADDVIGWGCSADLDLWVVGGHYCYFNAPDFALDGFMVENTGIVWVAPSDQASGTLDVYGAQWDSYDSWSGGGNYMYSRKKTFVGPSNPTPFDLQIVFHGFASVDAAQATHVSFKFLALGSRVRIGGMHDKIGMANPAIETAGWDNNIEVGAFDGVGGWPAGCVKLGNGSSCNTVTGCRFDPSIIGKTIFEAGDSGNNCIHDNKHVDNGDGMDVNINLNDNVHDNIA